jgi:alpha-glucosidase
VRYLGEPHHDGSALYVSDQRPELGARVTLWLRAPLAAGVTGVHVRAVHDGEPRYAEARVDETRQGAGGYGRTDVWRR